MKNKKNFQSVIFPKKDKIYIHTFHSTSKIINYIFFRAVRSVIYDGLIKFHKYLSDNMESIKPNFQIAHLQGLHPLQPPSPPKK